MEDVHALARFTWMRAFPLLLLVACDAGKKPEPPVPSPPTNVVPVANDASIAAQAQPIDAAVVADVDDETYGDPGDIVIEWLVLEPSVPLDRDPQILQQPVKLGIFVVGPVTPAPGFRPLELPPQFGALQPYNQSACKGDAYPLKKGELAKLTFYEGGAGGFFVKRKGDTFGVYSWAQTDGLCGDVDKPVECPRNEKQVASVTLKAKPDAKVHETIYELEKGVRKPFDCSAR
jgi:hypothetical protein